MKEVLSLMYLVSVYDPFFDTHREQCEYFYVFVLNKLSYLFSTTKEEEVDGGGSPLNVELTSLIRRFSATEISVLVNKIFIFAITSFITLHTKSFTVVAMYSNSSSCSKN